MSITEVLQQPHLIHLKSIGNSVLGYITVAEDREHIPFDIKRVYWTYYTPQNVIRGGHAHKVLHQIVFAVAGIIRYTVETRDGNKVEFVLDSPQEGLYLPPFTWPDIQFSHNAVMLCLASDPYDESDYIRDYNEFKALCENG